MRSRLGLFASTTVLAFASVGGVAFATYSYCPPPKPTVVSYEITKSKKTSQSTVNAQCAEWKKLAQKNPSTYRFSQPAGSSYCYVYKTTWS